VAVIVLRLGTAPIRADLRGALQVLKRSHQTHLVLAQNPLTAVDSVNTDTDTDTDTNPEDEFFDEFVALPRNVGYAAAMNVGASLSGCRGADVLLFITNDVVPEYGSFSQLVDLAQHKIGITAPVIRESDQRWQEGGSWSTWFGWARHHYSSTAPLTDRSVDWADGACLAIARECFDAVGGFDSDTFLYGEDLQICVRVRQRGFQVVVSPSVMISQSSGMHRRSGAHGYLLLRNELLCARRTGSSVQFVGTLATSVLRVGIELARSLRSGTFRRHHFRQAVGMTLAVTDAIRRRVGLPPPFLLKWADIPMAFPESDV
jgi:GT2 family glycosyltransferase